MRIELQNGNDVLSDLVLLISIGKCCPRRNGNKFSEYSASE